LEKMGEKRDVNPVSAQRNEKHQKLSEETRTRISEASRSANHKFAICANGCRLLHKEVSSTTLYDFESVNRS
jgi:hypothetical protein